MVSFATRLVRYSFIAFCSCMCIFTAHAISSLAKNDPYPVFTAIDPQIDRLLWRRSLVALDPDLDLFSRRKKDCSNISLSVFAQSASRGRDIQGRKAIPAACTPGQIPTTQVKSSQPLGLGDLTGRTSMLALMFGPLPQGRTLPPTLQEAFNIFFPTMTPGTIDDGSLQDPDQLYAFFGFPLRYNKRGFAVQASFMMGAGFGTMIETRVSSIRQTVKDFVTPAVVSEINTYASQCVIPGAGATATNTPCPFTAALNAAPASSPIPTTLSMSAYDPDIRAINETGYALNSTKTSFAARGIGEDDVNRYLMDQLVPIMSELGVNIAEFYHSSIEEARFSLFWRQCFPLNDDDDEIWPYVSIDPYFILTGSISPGTKIHPSTKFAIPFGNNNHSALGFDAGLNFYFVDTVEVGAQIGFTHFFERTICGLRVPNSRFQLGVFPFTTDACVTPGYNWDFALKLSAYHFLDNVSVWFQYLIVEHKQDKICLLKPDPAFLPHQLSRMTDWKVKMAHLGFTYDMSPNACFAFLWQAPISQRNAYKLNSVMFSFAATF